jgi:hypothetical protein
VGINRFVADRAQVLDDGAWLSRLGITFRHQGTGQTADEAAATTVDVDLDALRAYSTAVGDRTRAVMRELQDSALSPIIGPERIHAIVFEEGFGHPTPPLRLRRPMPDGQSVNVWSISVSRTATNTPARSVCWLVSKE